MRRITEWFGGLKTPVQIALIVAVAVVVIAGFFFGVDWQRVLDTTPIPAG